MKTPKERFPEGFAGQTKVFEGLHEAAHVYKLRDRNQFIMLYEVGPDARHFGLAVASRLVGPWRLLDNRWADAERLLFPPGMTAWTEMVSHGELLRHGCDEHLEVESGAMRFLIQGVQQAETRVPYPQIPWRLGIIRATVPKVSVQKK